MQTIHSTEAEYQNSFPHGAIWRDNADQIAPDREGISGLSFNKIQRRLEMLML